MKENKYDDPEFFENYSHMPRSVEGLKAAGEWEEFRGMLPDLNNKRVLDLGCGFGWHCRYVREHNARSVVGVDLSENMLARARAMTEDPHIRYYRLAIEDIDFAEGEFDLVISSLALHYVEAFESICRKIYHYLVPGGGFVFSVEHPVFTAMEGQDWYYGPDGEKLHWPLDRYHQEGSREAIFLDNKVIKYHRTLATQLNTLIGSGFTIRRVSELKPKPEQIDTDPSWQEAYRRPIFLLIAAEKPL